MRILEIGTHYPEYLYGDEVYGGVENNLKQCVTILSARHDVRVIGYNTRRETRRFEVDGVPVVAAGVLARVSSQSISLRLILEIARAKVDVIHLHTPEVLGMLAVLFFNRKVPVVITHHLDIVRQRILRIFVRPFYKLLLRRASAVIVYTQKYADHSPELTHVLGKVRVISHGTSEDDLVVTPEELAVATERRQSEFAGAPIVSFLGRHVGYKGVDTLIRAAVNLPEIHLMLGGLGPKTAEWRLLAAQLGVADRVHFVGRIPTARDRRIFFALSDLFVLPSTSRSESFGQVLVEAQLSGVPVVTTEIESGNTEIVQDGRTGFVTSPNDPVSLEATLRRALADVPRLDAIRRTARLNAQENFVERIAALRLLSLFEELLPRSVASMSHVSPEDGLDLTVSEALRAPHQVH